MGEIGVDVFLDGQHVRWLPTCVRRKHLADLRGPEMRGEISIHCVGIVGRKRILIGRHDHSRGWVEGRRQLLEGYESLPLEISGGAVHGEVASPPFTNGELAGGVISDISVHVGIDEVRAGAGEARKRGGELLPIAGAVDIENRELEYAW